MTTESTDLTVEWVEFELPAIGGDDSPLEVIRVNLSGKPLKLNDLTKVTIPTGGRTEWDVETSRGTTSHKDLIGVIIHNQTTRAFFQGAYGEGNDRPTCSSNDGITGSPGIDGIVACAACPMNAFESAENGKGKACTENENLFLLRSGDPLPIVVRLSPGSLGSWERFIKQLTAEGTRRDRVIIAISLEKLKTQYVFSAATFQAIGFLDDDQFHALRDYSEAFIQLTQQQEAPVPFVHHYEDAPHPAEASVHPEDYDDLPLQ